MKNQLISFSLAALLLTGCDKDKMPKATQTGKQILSCKVDGKVHTYEGKFGTINGNGVELSYYKSPANDASQLKIYASDVKYEDGIQFALNTTDITVGKKYVIYPRTALSSNVYVDNTKEPPKEYLADSTQSFVIFERYDDVVAGKFEMHCQDSTREVHITNGSFDLTP